MNLLSIENISKSYSEKILFKDASLGINEGDKIGVIGVNGTGKSTFLKVVAGIEPMDEGNIIKANGVTIEYLSQNPVFYEDTTVLQQVFRGNNNIMQTLRDYQDTLDELNLDPNNEAYQKKLMNLSDTMDKLNLWSLESQAKTILTKLGINNFKEKIGNLSGGQKKRVALATALISPADLLILDEPTNHMDNETISWLENFLNSRKGALLMITHDRYFLDRVTNKIIELDRGRLFSYTGNYSIFLDKKIEREELESASEAKRQNLLRRELAWIKRGAKARSTKQKARIQRFEDLSNDAPLDLIDKVEISTAHSRLGNKTVEFKNVSKSLGEKTLIKDFSYTLTKDDRIGIIGPNGMGKSTLMNLISNRMTPDEGEIIIGDTVKLGYFSQDNCEMNENLRVIESINEVAEIIETADGSKISASQMLERFLFPPAQQWTPISNLSGGEKRRLFLLKVLMSSPNILLLDEPTNDLDIETLTILEDYIENFNGIVIAVSHDRYFLDKIADKIFSFEGKGNILEHTGNYTDFCEFENNLSQDIVESSCEEKKTVDKKSEPKKASSQNKTLKFSYKEKLEYETIEQFIEDLESKLETIDEKISKASTDFQLLQELLEEKEETELLLLDKMERFEFLSNLAEEIEENKANK